MVDKYGPALGAVYSDHTPGWEKRCRAALNGPKDRSDCFEEGMCQVFRVCETGISPV